MLLSHSPYFSSWSLETSSGQVSGIGSLQSHLTFTDTNELGPWNLGRFSKPVGIVACAWVALIIPVLCFPAVRGSDLNSLTMNYTCLLYGGVMILALLWYAIDARKWFKGPKINVDHMIHRQALGGEAVESEKQDALYTEKDE